MKYVRCFFGIILAILSVVVSVMAQEQYYVWDGSNLQPLFNTQGIVCDHWAIWLYTDSTADPQPAKGWGEIDGASADEVQAKYQESRDKMERLLASSHTGYEVHLGPVAVIKPPPQADNPSFASASKEADDLCDRLIKDFGLALKLIDAAKKLQGYYYQDHQGSYYLNPEKSELREFLENLHKKMEKANELRHKLNDLNGPALAAIQGELDAMNQSLAATENEGQMLANKLHSNDDTSWSGRPASGGDGTFHNKWQESVTLFDGGVDALYQETIVVYTESDPSHTNTSTKRYHIPFEQIASVSQANGGDVTLMFKSELICQDEETSWLSGGQSYTDHTIAINLHFQTQQDANAFITYISHKITR